MHVAGHAEVKPDWLSDCIGGSGAYVAIFLYSIFFFLLKRLYKGLGLKMPFVEISKYH
jgi:hypothetical protein